MRFQLLTDLEFTPFDSSSAPEFCDFDTDF